MSFYKKSYRSLIRLSLKNLEKYSYKDFLNYKYEKNKINNLFLKEINLNRIYEWNINNEIVYTYGQNNKWLSIPYTFKFMVRNMPPDKNDKKLTLDALELIKSMNKNNINVNNFKFIIKKSH